MDKFSSRPSRSYLSILIIFILGWSVSAYSNEDLYLKELEAEAEMDSPASGSAASDDPAKANSADPRQSEKNDFEARLSTELPATFRTYKMLSADDKMKVFGVYITNDKDMKKATRLLFELYYK